MKWPKENGGIAQNGLSSTDKFRWGALRCRGNTCSALAASAPDIAPEQKRENGGRFNEPHRYVSDNVRVKVIANVVARNFTRCGMCRS